MSFSISVWRCFGKRDGYDANFKNPFEIEVSPLDTTDALRLKINSAYGLAPEHMIFSHKGKYLKDSDTIAESKLSPGELVQMVYSLCDSCRAPLDEYEVCIL